MWSYRSLPFILGISARTGFSR